MREVKCVGPVRRHADATTRKWLDQPDRPNPFGVRGCRSVEDDGPAACARRRVIQRLHLEYRCMEIVQKVRDHLVVGEGSRPRQSSEVSQQPRLTHVFDDSGRNRKLVIASPLGAPREAIAIQIRRERHVRTRHRDHEVFDTNEIAPGGRLDDVHDLLALAAA